MFMSHKRRREGYEERQEATIDQRIADAESVRSEIEAVYGILEEQSLWDANKVWTLVQPTLYFSPESQKWFKYVGRHRAKQLYEALLALEPRRQLLVQGAKGSGKSTAIFAIVGLLSAKKLRQVVYVNAGLFLRCPVIALRHALLVASGDEDLAQMDSLKELADWCEGQAETLLFVIDDWDTLEDASALEAKLVEPILERHILVKVSSLNSRASRLCSTSDKPPPTFNFYGPFGCDELKTWISQSSLTAGSLRDLDRLTGGMPGLLRYYEEVQGDESAFTKKIAQPYTLKLLYKFIALQTSQVDLRAALELVVTSDRSPRLGGPLDLTCFYLDKNSKLKILSPYLRRMAERYVTDRAELQLRDIVEAWAEAVRKDCVSRGRNPAHVGWNVEGLVMGVMRYQQKVWAGLDFKHYRTYKHGHERVALGKFSTEQLMHGVLLGPEAFNEKAVDAIYVILLGTVLNVIALQITVSRCKAKARKMSHEVWLREVVPKLAWGSKGQTLLQQYVYVMPDSVKPQDVKLEAGEASGSEEQSQSDDDDTGESGEDEDDDADEVGERAGDGRCAIPIQAATEALTFKKLKDVHACLADFDELLNLRKPVELQKMEIKNCAGKVKDKATCEMRPCKHSARTTDAVYFCCPAHHNEDRLKECLKECQE